MIPKMQTIRITMKTVIRRLMANSGIVICALF
jgi:hypothetical protein